MTLNFERVTDMALGEYHDENLSTSTIDFATVVYENFSDFSTANATLSKRCEWNGLNTAMTLLLVFTFLLNAAASIVLFRVPLVTMNGRSNPVNFCIRFLNSCDVLQAFFLVVMPAFATDECTWLGGELSCSIMGFIVLFFLLVSPLITILMAFDRAVALYQPFKYRSNLGLKMLKVLLPSACFLVFITTALPIFGVGEYHVVKGRRFCLLDTITNNPVDRTYVIAVHSVFLAGLFFMLSCTIAFQFKICTMSFTKKHKESKSKTRKKVSSRRTRNATLTTMGVCGIFIFCYMPYVIRVLVEAVTIKKSHSFVTWFTFGLAFMQPLLNPIVYIGTNARYRQELVALIKNMKVSEWDTSSESGTTHQQASRGAFSGFRRRLSSGGGSRNSKRGSKRKHFGSRTSLNNQNTTSPAESHFVAGNNAEKRASWKRHSKPPPSGPENCNKGEKSATLKTFIQPPYPDDGHPSQEASSSSGVRSYDESVEKIIVTPPPVAVTLTFRLSGNPGDLVRYGRSFRRDSGLPGPKFRERSHTVSGGEKSQSEVDNDPKLHCVSTPTLTANAERVCNLQISSGEPESEAEVMSVHVYGRSPKLSPAKEIDSSPKLTLNMSNTLPNVNVERSASDDDDIDTDVYFSVPETPDTTFSSSKGNSFTEKNHLKKHRARSRPSYKKALETTSRHFLSRKPSKRDSGVGDS